MKLQCVSVRGNGQRPEGERNFGEIAVVESDRRVEGDYRQEVNGVQREQEALEIIQDTTFIS